MGQKVNPTSFRTGKFLPWKSRWFAEDSSYKDFLLEDIKIRKTLMDKLKLAGITSVEIERLPKSISIILTVSRPGVVIGRGGTGVEDVKKIIEKVVRDVRGQYPKNLKIDIKVNEVQNPELSAQLIASRIVMDLERRLPHRRVVAKAIERAMQAGALGIKIVLAGRIGGTEIARREKYHEGSIPAQTLREDVDYAEIPALLKRGYVGVKVYVHRKKEEE